MEVRGEEGKVLEAALQALAPRASALEAERQRGLRRFLLLLGGAALFGLLLLALGGESLWPLFPALLLLLLALGEPWGYAARLKGEAARLLAEGLGLRYEGRGLPLGEVLEAGLLPVPDRYASEDRLHGQVGAFGLDSADVHLLRREVVRTREGTQVRYRTLFQGVFLRLDLPFPAPAEVLVLPRGAAWAPSAGLEALRLESPEFGRRFAAFASDQVGGRVFLTPAVMEGLLRYRERVGVAPRLRLRERRLYAALSGVDRFPLSPWALFRPLDREAWRRKLQRFLQDVELALALAEALRLEERRRRLGLPGEGGASGV
ncbi:DUF3137 domain-containing protein [Thermus thermamylovorans]|uniref:DUF3137 domain-containing protein n=1 Tax=Thermus thermamylovorans TaxID=2509362 RepID=A0A4Q9B4E0_9DEIN|nr:DUF3137 domain-containing protein [Thermus thermamylovorans]TBH20809.1 DUF3137 domain-containing protein [Thermus thermamylovorans]